METRMKKKFRNTQNDIITIITTIITTHSRQLPSNVSLVGTNPLIRPCQVTRSMSQCVK